MKNIFLTLAFLITFLSVGQTRHTTGVILGDPSGTASDPANGKEGQIYWNSTLLKFRKHNGTTWSDLAVSGTYNLQNVSDIGATTDNNLTIFSATSPNFTVTNSSTTRSSKLYANRLDFVRDGFTLSLLTPTLSANRAILYPDKDGTLALEADIGEINVMEEISEPVDAYFGERVQPVLSTSSGYFVNATQDKATGYLVKSNNNTGTSHYSGYGVEGYGTTSFIKGFGLSYFGTAYSYPYLRENTALHSPNDINIIGTTNTSDISFRLGKISSSSLVETNLDVVLDLSSNRTITAPQLTEGLITTGGTRSLITKEYFDNNAAAAPLDASYSVAWDGDITNSASRNAIYDKIEAILLTSGYDDEAAQDAVGTILTDTAEINFTYTDATPTITADLVSGSIDETKLDTSVNTSLDKADTALQTEVDGSITNEIQTIDVLTLTSTTLGISLSSDGVATETLDLSPLQDGTGTDDQTASEVTNTASGNLTSTDVQSSLVELQLDIDTRSVGAHTVDTDTNLSNEEVEDIVGAMTVGNTETLITVTYEDTTNDIDFIVNDDLSLYDNTTSNFSTGSHTVDTNTQLSQEQVQDFVGTMSSGNTETLIDVTYDDLGNSFDFIVNDDLSLYNNTTSNFSTGSHTTDTNLTQEEVQDFVGTMVTGNTETRIAVTYDDLNDQFDFSVNDDLSLYDNTTSNFSTGSHTVNTDSQTLTWTDGTNTLAISGGNSQVITGFSEGAHTADTNLSQEEVQDFVGTMVTGNTETLIAVTYDDTNNEFDFVVDDDLSLYDNTTSNFSVGAHTVDTNTQLSDEQVQDKVGAMFAGNTETLITATYQDIDGTIDLVVNSDLSLYNNTTSNFSVGAHTVDTNKTKEEVQDDIGTMFVGNTETLITVTYDDAGDEIDFVVDNNLANYSNATSNFSVGAHTVDTNTLGPDGDKGDITVGGSGTTLNIDISAVGSAEIANGTIDELDLDTSVNASLDKADTSVQLTGNQSISGNKNFTTDSGVSENKLWSFDIDGDIFSGVVFDGLNTYGYGESTTVIKTGTQGLAVYSSEDLQSGSIEAGSFVKTGGTSSQFLKANGSVDSNTYATTSSVSLTDKYIAVGTGSGIEGTSDFQYDTASNQLTIQDGGLGSDVNIDIGKSALESLNIGAYANALNTTVDYIEFASKTESTATDAGEFRFNVDGVADKLIINDFGINIGGIATVTESFNTLDTSGDKFKIGFNTGIGRDFSGNNLYIHTNTGQDILLGGSVGGVQNDVIIKSGNLTVGNGTAGTKTLSITGDAEISTDAQVLGKLAVGIATGSTAQLHVEFSNALTSNAGILIEQNSTGDATTTYNVPAASYTLGIDNSNADKFVLSSGTTLGTSDRMVVDSNGITATDFILTSDRRLKENIQDYNPKHIPVRWREFDIKYNGNNAIGVIADELEKTNPEFVNKGNTPEDMDSVKYIQLLIAKVAELEARIKELENK